MRLLIVGWETPFVFGYGGLYTYLTNLVWGLRWLGVDVVCVGTCPDPPKSYREEGLACVCDSRVVDLSSSNVAGIQLDIARVCNELVPTVDAVLVNDAHVSLCLYACHRHNVPGIYVAHTLSATPSELVGLMLADAVVTNSRMMAEALTSLAKLFAEAIHPPMRPLPRVRVIYPAYPILPFSSAKRVPRKDARQWLCSQVSCDEKVVAVVARAGQPNKNVELAIKAVQLLRESGMNVSLVVAGRGWGRRSEAWGGYLGDLSSEEMEMLYRAVDALVLPSSFEPFGLVALEAVAHGVPVAISKRAGALEVLGDSVPSFDPTNPRECAEAIRRALEEGLSTEARKRVLSRTWIDVAREFIDTVRSIDTSWRDEFYV